MTRSGQGDGRRLIAVLCDVSALKGRVNYEQADGVNPAVHGRGCFTLDREGPGKLLPFEIAAFLVDS